MLKLLLIGLAITLCSISAECNLEVLLKKGFRSSIGILLFLFYTLMSSVGVLMMGYVIIPAIYTLLPIPK